MNPEYPLEIFFIDHNSQPQSDVSWHWHQELELIIVNSGDLDLSIDRSTHRITPGQGVIIQPGLFHSLHSEPSEKYSYYSITVHPDYLFGDTERFFSLADYKEQLTKQSFRALVLSESVPAEAGILDRINDVITVNLTRPYGYELMTKGYLCQIAAQLIALIHKQPDLLPIIPVSPDEQRVKLATDYIQNHFADAISLDDIAASIHLSKSECCRCFKRTLDMTPFEYVMKYRIFEAAKRLRDPVSPTSSISEIAIEVGFNNISYFNKLFRKYAGCTPRQYVSNTKHSSASGGSGVFLFQ